jgi:hypothetical protein
VGSLGYLLFATPGEFLDYLVADVKPDSSTAVSVRQTNLALKAHHVCGQLFEGDYTDRVRTDTKGHLFLVRPSQFGSGRADANTGLTPTLGSLGPLQVSQFDSITILLNQGGLEPATVVVAVAVASIADR